MIFLDDTILRVTPLVLHHLVQRFPCLGGTQWSGYKNQVPNASSLFKVFDFRTFAVVEHESYRVLITVISNNFEVVT